jgi:hypothetical protein
MGKLTEPAVDLDARSAVGSICLMEVDPSVRVPIAVAATSGAATPVAAAL